MLVHPAGLEPAKVPREVEVCSGGHRDQEEQNVHPHFVCSPSSFPLRRELHSLCLANLLMFSISMIPGPLYRVSHQLTRRRGFMNHGCLAAVQTQSRSRSLDRSLALLLTHCQPGQTKTRKVSHALRYCWKCIKPL